MYRRLEPMFPSFTLVLTSAYEPFELPPYESSDNEDAQPYSATQFVDPLMTTVDYRSDHHAIPTMSWEDFWGPQEEAQEASSLQAALDHGKGAGYASSLRRRRFSDLVVDLALVLRRKCSIRSLRRQRKTPVLKISHLDLAS